MASIDRRNGRYRVRWRDPDGTCRSRQVPSMEAARRLRREVEARVASGRRWEPVDASEIPRLQEALEGYIRHCHRAYAPGTVRQYAQRLDVFQRFLRERQGAQQVLRVSLFSRALLEDLYDWLLHSGRHDRPRRPSSVRKYVQLVQQVWAWAYDHDHYGPEVPPPKRLKMAKPPRRVTRAPTWAHTDHMISVSKGWQRDLYMLLRFTGLRVQQAMGLTWDDVDLALGELLVPGHLGKSRAEKVGRIVPISTHLAAELAKWGRRDGWLIDCRRENRVARSRDASRAWRRAAVPPALWKQRPHHAFRKAFVSGLKSLGADADAVEYLVGHDLGLRGVYMDPSALPLRATVDLLPGLSEPGSSGRVIPASFTSAEPPGDDSGVSQVCPKLFTDQRTANDIVWLGGNGGNAGVSTPSKKKGCDSGG